ncbi:MAG TPA: hypothetical protein DCS24_05225 [Erythrobacter sp.]|nr:hypothetical protein [Erythrobacter sp.]
MNFDLSEEQQLFTDTVERFSAPIDVEARRKLRMLGGGYDRARWQELAELGLIALAVDEEQGGMGGSSVDLALVGEAIGKAISPDPWLENAALPARILSCAGEAEALERAMSGEAIFTLAWAERCQRYCTAPKQTRLEGDRLTGEKTFVFGAAIADHFLITARDGDDLAIISLPRETDGLDLRTYPIADGSLAGELRFNHVQVAAENKLSVSQDDLAQAVADTRLLAAAESVGLGQRLLDDTLTYVKEREQFGVPIGSFQTLQHRLVDCYAKIEQARSMLYRAAMSDAADMANWQSSCAGAKAYISETIDHVAREAVQMHGGMGITDELAIGHAMKRLLVLSRLFGDVETNLAEYAVAA